MYNDTLVSTWVETFESHSCDLVGQVTMIILLVVVCRWN